MRHIFQLNIEETGFSEKGQSSDLNANIQIVKSGQEILRSDGPYGEEGMIIQEFHALPKFGDNYTLVGSWLVNDQACGMCLREDNSLITQDLSRFYPHVILD